MIRLIKHTIEESFAWNNPEEVGESIKTTKVYECDSEREYKDLDKYMVRSGWKSDGNGTYVKESAATVQSETLEYVSKVE